MTRAKKRAKMRAEVEVKKISDAIISASAADINQSRGEEMTSQLDKNEEAEVFIRVCCFIYISQNIN